MSNTELINVEIPAGMLEDPAAFEAQRRELYGRQAHGESVDWDGLLESGHVYGDSETSASEIVLDRLTAPDDQGDAEKALEDAKKTFEYAQRSKKLLGSLSAFVISATPEGVVTNVARKLEVDGPTQEEVARQSESLRRMRTGTTLINTPHHRESASAHQRSGGHRR